MSSILSAPFKELQKAGYSARQNLKDTTTSISINHPLYRYAHSKQGNHMTQRWGAANIAVQGAIWTRHCDNVSDNGYRVYYCGSDTEKTTRPTTREVGDFTEALLRGHGIPLAGHFQADEAMYILIPPHSLYVPGLSKRCKYWDLRLSKLVGLNA